jgi:hypothetical protein
MTRVTYLAARRAAGSGRFCCTFATNSIEIDKHGVYGCNCDAGQLAHERSFRTMMKFSVFLLG